MKLFLTKDISCDSSRFNVCDERGNKKYTVSGFRTASTDRMVISAVEGTPLVTIRVAPFPVFHAFSISDGHERFAMTATHLRRGGDFRFHGISWALCRSRDMRSFEIIDADNTLVMLQNADRFLATGVYELDVYNEHRELFCIAAAICADSLNYRDKTETIPT